MLSSIFRKIKLDSYSERQLNCGENKIVLFNQYTGNKERDVIETVKYAARVTEVVYT